MEDAANRIVEHYERHALSWDADRRAAGWGPLSHDQRAAAGSGATESWIWIGRVQSRHDRNRPMNTCRAARRPASKRATC
jgi:hypothetical protein